VRVGCSGLLELLWFLASLSGFCCYFMQCILFSFLKLLPVFLDVSSLFVAGFYCWSVADYLFVAKGSSHGYLWLLSF
jgi:hypothetical protein